jgi:hypothetical protein
MVNEALAKGDGLFSRMYETDIKATLNKFKSSASL